MKKVVILAALAGFAAAPAFASEVQSHCEAYVAENGGDASGCACLGDAAPDGSELAGALLAIQSEADLEAADDAAKAAIGACFPDA